MVYTLYIGKGFFLRHIYYPTCGLLEVGSKTTTKLTTMVC
jgi:hypothetical protein